jgi:uncharacterized protein (TIGR00255 family)
MKSMTGYGRAHLSLNDISVTIEISSVNKRHLEIFVNAPKEWQRFEYIATKQIKSFIERGSIRVSISVAKISETDRNQFFNENLIKRDLSWMKKFFLEDEMNFKITPEIILHLTNLHKTEQSIPPLDDISTDLEKTLKCACAELVNMRKAEGDTIRLDLRRRIKSLSNLIKRIEKSIDGMVLEHKKRLLEKLNQSGIAVEVDDDRLLKEIALFAEKSDVSEEITRLKSHFVQMNDTLDSKGAIGRKFEFLIQEISRELNTFCSKSCRTQSTQLAIEGKTELEKLREQVLNIE